MLSQLHSTADPLENSDAYEYRFPYDDEVRISVSNANEALIKYAEPFLQDDPKFLYEVNAKLYGNNESGEVFNWKQFKIWRQS